jgi:hypothetical protein
VLGRSSLLAQVPKKTIWLVHWGTAAAVFVDGVSCGVAPD